MTKYLSKFDQLYDHLNAHDAYMSDSKSTGNPLWGDAAMFGLLHDNMLMGFVTKEDLARKYPRLLLFLVGTKRSVREGMDQQEGCSSGI